MQLRVTTVEYYHILSNFGKSSNLLQPPNKKKRDEAIDPKEEIKKAEAMVLKLLHFVGYTINVYNTLERVSS